jgi:hypothetical protein
MPCSPGAAVSKGPRHSVGPCATFSCRFTLRRKMRRGGDCNVCQGLGKVARLRDENRLMCISYAHHHFLRLRDESRKRPVQCLQSCTCIASLRISRYSRTVCCRVFHHVSCAPLFGWDDATIRKARLLFWAEQPISGYYVKISCYFWIHPPPLLL